MTSDMGEKEQVASPPETEAGRIRNLIDQFAAGLHTADEMPGLILATLCAHADGAMTSNEDWIVCTRCNKRWPNSGDATTEF
jgi:hypothetical protein